MLACRQGLGHALDHQVRDARGHGGRDVDILGTRDQRDGDLGLVVVALIVGDIVAGELGAERPVELDDQRRLVRGEGRDGVEGGGHETAAQTAKRSPQSLAASVTAWLQAPSGCLLITGSEPPESRICTVRS